MPGERDDRPVSVVKALGRASLAFFVFPNLLFILAGVVVFTNRAWINIDYLLLGIAWLWIPVWLRVAGFAFLVIVDAVASTALIYNVNPLAGLVAMLDAPLMMNLRVLIGFIIAASLASAIGWFAVNLLRDRHRRWLVGLLMLCFLTITLAWDVDQGANRLSHGRTDHGARNVATSSVIRLAWDLRDRIISASRTPQVVPAASDLLRTQAAHGDVVGYNVLFITAESMGDLADTRLHDFAWQPLRDPALAARYTKRTGLVDYRGGTTSGELRELCGIFGDYITLPANVLPYCLPRALHRHGYTTYAVHGFRRSYYNRARWYPMLFDTVFFDNKLKPIAGDRRCGTEFRGICDADSFQKVRELVLTVGRKPRFVYWMTLDAHTPVDLARRHEFDRIWAEGQLDAVPTCRLLPEVCMEAMFQHELLHRVADLALDPRLPPTRIVVVGDHAPAFVRREQAAQFVPGRVPYVELLPVEAGGSR